MNLSQFKLELENNKNAFLLGNGFSMNFDSSFENIHDRLFETHKDLLRKTSYSVNSPNAILKKKLTTNYKNILKELKYIDENKFESIFEDAIIFAKSIITFPNMEMVLNESKSLRKLTFGISQWDGIKNIYKTGIERGARNVNIEYWTILIYMYYVLKQNQPNGYTFPSNNFFISLLKIGDSPNISIGTKDPMIETCNNGFNTYYRMLYSLAIFNKGKAISCDNLDKISLLNISKIHTLLAKGDVVLTLNYDHLIEELWSDIYIEHLHGSYRLNCKNYFHYQSLSFTHEDQEVSISDILIGDYFCNKTFLPIVANSSKGTSSSIKESADDKIYRYIKEKRVSHVIIFGMNINNDQDLLRYIMLAFEANQIKNPSITYCYFTDEERKEFSVQYSKVITFGKIVVDYCKNITVNYVKTQEILDEYFFK